MINTVKKNYHCGKFDSYQITYKDSNIEYGVPLDPANTDYQEIQKWIANGGVVIDNPPQENN